MVQMFHVAASQLDHFLSKYHKRIVAVFPDRIEPGRCAPSVISYVVLVGRLPASLDL